MNQRVKKAVDTSSSWAANLIIAALAVVALAAFFSPVRAAECYTLEVVRDQTDSIFGPGRTFVLTPAELGAAVKDVVAAGFLPDGDSVTRGLLIADPLLGPVLGLEVDGCLMDPVVLLKSPLGKLDSGVSA